MIELAFASYCNKFPGQVGWVVGRGPTQFQYEALGRTEGPVFFINDAVSQEKWLEEQRPSFFFAHDAAMDTWLFQEQLRSIPVLITDQPESGPPKNRRKGLIGGADDPRLANLSRAIFYRRNGPWDQASILSCRREDIQQCGQLCVWSGTIHPLLHFAWYLGCSKLCLIGCDGLPNIGYDCRLENRSASSNHEALAIRLRQEIIFRQLSLPREYLGTIPHRIMMCIEMRLRRENREEFLAWVEKLNALFQAFCCSEVRVDEQIDGSNGFEIKTVWPSIDTCIECLISPAYRETTLNMDGVIVKGNFGVKVLL